MPGRISPQAQSLLDAMIDVGVDRHDVRVRTDPGRSGSGAAFASPRSADAEKVILDHAQHLADRGLGVSVVRHSCGHPGLPEVSSASGGSTVTDVPVDVPCRACR